MSKMALMIVVDGVLDNKKKYKVIYARCDRKAKDKSISRGFAEGTDGVERISMVEVDWEVENGVTEMTLPLRLSLIEVEPEELLRLVVGAE